MTSKRPSGKNRPAWLAVVACAAIVYGLIDPLARSERGFEPSAEGGRSEPRRAAGPINAQHPRAVAAPVAEPLADNAPAPGGDASTVDLSGRVVDQSGQGVADQAVLLHSLSRDLHLLSSTDLSGAFRLAGLAPARDYVLQVLPRAGFEDFRRLGIEIGSQSEVMDIELQPVPRGTLSGRIVDPWGRAVGNIELVLEDEDADSWSTTAITDVNGAFTVADFPRERYRLAINWQQTLRVTGLAFDPDRGLPVEITVDTGPFELAGRVRDEAGQSVDGADVFLHWVRRDDGIEARSDRWASTNSRGEFRFSGLGPGNHELEVSSWKGGTVSHAPRRTINIGVDFGELEFIVATR